MKMFLLKGPNVLWHSTKFRGHCLVHVEHESLFYMLPLEIFFIPRDLNVFI